MIGTVKATVPPHAGSACDRVSASSHWFAGLPGGLRSCGNQPFSCNCEDRESLKDRYPVNAGKSKQRRFLMGRHKDTMRICSQTIQTDRNVGGNPN